MDADSSDHLDDSESPWPRAQCCYPYKAWTFTGYGAVGTIVKRACIQHAKRVTAHSVVGWSESLESPGRWILGQLVQWPSSYSVTDFETTIVYSKEQHVLMLDAEGRTGRPPGRWGSREDKDVTRRKHGTYYRRSTVEKKSMTIAVPGEKYWKESRQTEL